MRILTEKRLNMIHEMKIMQSKLDENILKEHQCEWDLSKGKLALIDELGEMNHENKASWCWWKYTQAPVDKDKLLEELVDAWHFALSIDNHENEEYCHTYEADVHKNYGKDLPTLIAYAVLKVETILPIMVCITYKLGFNLDDVFEKYREKNKVNYLRLQNGY